MTWQVEYHIPPSQVYAGSRGGASGNVHLAVPQAALGGAAQRLVAVRGRAGVLWRQPGQALCGKGRAWMARPPHPAELEMERCVRCVRASERYGVAWPAEVSS